MASRAHSGRPTSGAADFADVTTWIFDLDDTLYPRALDIHAAMQKRVRLYLARRLDLTPPAAEALHAEYVGRFGATLQAVVEMHGAEPTEFLDFVHDVDLSGLRPDPALIAALGALPGRRVVFTNGSSRHAEAVLEALTIRDLFDVVWHIESCGFVGKPQRSAYEAFLTDCGVEPRTAAMFDDRAANLVVPHELGIRTVLVAPPGAPAAHSPLLGVDATTQALSEFLSMLVAGRRDMRESFSGSSLKNDAR